ncbi:MAG: PTS lactose/cellobiose transporter subunit IIA [Anaerorhabdus sp.]
MEGLELICFRIISIVGTARSLYIEAIQEAKESNFDLAYEKIREGEEIFIEGHRCHAELVQKEASGTPVEVSLLLAHAEDQLMSAEGFAIVAREFVELYEKINT